MLNHSIVNITPDIDRSAFSLRYYGDLEAILSKIVLEIYRKDTQHAPPVLCYTAAYINDSQQLVFVWGKKLFCLPLGLYIGKLNIGCQECTKFTFQLSNPCGITAVDNIESTLQCDTECNSCESTRDWGYAFLPGCCPTDCREPVIYTPPYSIPLAC